MALIDGNIHLGDLIVSGTLAALGWMFKGAYNTIKNFVRESELNRSRISLHGDVIDQHSYILMQHGLAKGVKFQRVGRRHDDPTTIEEVL